jgi:PleD family two-component response regulator
LPIEKKIISLDMKDKKQYKILVVDDEKDIQEFIEYNLKKEGYDVF